MFVLKSDYGTAGDQEQAIQELIKQINEGQERCVLMGVTGSGKTFTMAQIIEKTQKSAFPRCLPDSIQTSVRTFNRYLPGIYNSLRASFIADGPSSRKICLSSAACA